MSNKIFGIIGCGWLGLAVAEKWISAQKQVHGTTTTESKIRLLESKGVYAHLLTGDLSKDETQWIKSIDVLLLCVPPTRLKEKYAALLLELVKQAKPTTKTIMISSTSVYGNRNQLATEQDALDGTGRNASYVIEAEKQLKELVKENLTIIRMSGLIGKDRHPVKYMQGKVIAGGNEPVNLIHLTDAIGVIDHIVQQNIWGETFNASAPKNPSRKTYYSYAAQQFNIEVPTFDLKKQNSKTISSDKLIQEYQYVFTFPDLLAHKLKQEIEG